MLDGDRLVMNNLLTALITKISGSSLFNDVGGRIYLDRAPDSCELPYIVFFIVSDTPDDTFTESLEDILIQFSLFSSSSSATEITTMYTDLKALFDDCSFSITSNTLLWFKRNNLTTMVDEITVVDAMQQVKAWHVDYSIMLTKL